MQARSRSWGEGAVPPAPGASHRPLMAGELCRLPEWQLWHNQGGLTFSKGATFEPCATWQLAQSSLAGGCSHRNGPRFSAWQV